MVFSNTNINEDLEPADYTSSTDYGSEVILQEGVRKTSSKGSISRKFPRLNQIPFAFKLLKAVYCLIL